ncbi:hypothetical protein M409DRAFT_23746 [Zasmidium cellare ATCC 36951]|uniref:Uncharacterized protein n=1 Tax=Zasmidium cellare ATCC 36951 TaxID=1080233 RepID=A0A6A6CIL2_ZASCE|nr:uncharacterized protein M409DRAFT_23746 [Zasmidium cellare ATCC 36951]KAF2166018.1 hypothetical protein M409DRAFT_23746 [Zasmidium cellare ATCC 36951]
MELESEKTATYPFGTFNLSTTSCMAYPRALDEPVARQDVTSRPACTDLIHSCVRDMLQTMNAAPCVDARSPKRMSLAQFLASGRRLAETFNTTTACTCSSAFPVAYLLSTAFQMFRSAVESLLPKEPTIAQRREHPAKLQSLRTELEKISKLADSFNALYCQPTSRDAGQSQLLKYRLSVDLKYCLDDLDERAGWGG